jgi:putative hemolysin
MYNGLSMPWLIIATSIATLIFFNALYVAAEFSTVSSRRTRLAQMAEDGDRLAQLLYPIVEDPVRLDAYVAACQIGITVTSLTLGFYGQAALTPLIAPTLADVANAAESAVEPVVATGLLILLTGLQVILGELVPKNVAIQYPERLALLAVLPMRWSMILFRPLIWLFNGSGRLILRLLGLTPSPEHTHIHSPSEIQLLVEESTAGGLIDPEERRLLTNALKLREQTVEQVMVPRTQMLGAPVDQPSDELLSQLADSPYSRLVLYGDTIDDVVGTVHLRDLLCLPRQTGGQDVSVVMHTVPFVPETLSVSETLALLQRERRHMAIVLDEFAGTAGLVTVEDLTEVIFGGLQDEFDVSRSAIDVRADGRAWMRGDALIRDVEERLNLGLPAEDVNTIGGLVLGELGYLPTTGEEVQIGGTLFRVEDVSGNRVDTVSLALAPEQRQALGLLPGTGPAT